MHCNVSIFQPHSEWDRAASMRVLPIARSATFSVCGLKVSCRSRVTPRRKGRGLYLMAAPSMVMVGSHFASPVHELKKLTSLFVAFSFNFHSAHYSTTMSTARCTDSTAFCLSRCVERIETSSANMQLMFSAGGSLARLLM